MPRPIGRGIFFFFAIRAAKAAKVPCDRAVFVKITIRPQFILAQV
jgi:hypothetical protein